MYDSFVKMLSISLLSYFLPITGIDILRKLAIKSDVLVENFVPGKLSNYGLDYESLKNDAPHLIHCSISGEL